MLKKVCAALGRFVTAMSWPDYDLRPTPVIIHKHDEQNCKYCK